MKILQILPTLNNCGGVENYIINYYREMIKDKIVFDFLINDYGDENFIDEVENNGSKVYILEKFSFKNLKKIRKQAEEIIKNESYDVVHCHTANAAFIYLKICKKYKVKLRILHSHQTQAADKFTHKLRNKPLIHLGKKYANFNIACSKLAGDFLFKKNYVVVNNAININKFDYSETKREQLRKKLNIEADTYCIGNIGRFCNQKNQLFLIDIFKSIKEQCEFKAKLLLIGDGELKEKIIDKIRELNIESDVILTGVVNNTYDYYNVMDIFVLPSLYEGLPVVGVEAQYNGLSVITSTNVTEELDFTNNVKYLSLSESITKWAFEIINILRQNKRNKVFDDDYNIEKQYVVLKEIYSNYLKMN